MAHVPRPKLSDPAEPLAGVAGVTALATAVLALIVAFGVPVDNDQQAAILGVLAVAGPVVTGLVGRGRVFAPRTVAKMLQGKE
jgi:hypothetical protein